MFSKLVCEYMYLASHSGVESLNATFDLGFQPKLCRTLSRGSDHSFLTLPVYFRLSPLQKHMRKVVGGFGKKSCVSTGERKPGNTCASQTAMI